MADIEKASARLDKELRKEEGERFKPYLCTAGVPTIGVGATTYPDGRKVTLADPPITKSQMDRMLSIEIGRYVHEVMDMVHQVVTTNQLIALVLCGYNIGLPALRGSSMIRLHNAGDFAGAARAFSLWNKKRNPKTKQLEDDDALAARRLREAAVYSTRDDDDESPVIPAPQAVEGESHLAKSPITQSGVAVTVTGLVSGAAAVKDQVSTVSDAAKTVKEFGADVIGIPANFVLPAVLVIAGVVVLVMRYKQRRLGWA